MEKENKKSVVSLEEKEKLEQIFERIAPVSMGKEQREIIISVYEKHRTLFQELSK